MVKEKRKVREKTQSNTPSFWSKHPLLTFVIIAFVLLLVFYNQLMLGNKTFVSPDKMSSKAVQPFVNDALNKGIFPLWCPYIFGGMPSFASLLSAPRVNVPDQTAIKVLSFLDSFLPIPQFTFMFLNYLLFAVLMYALMRSLKVNRMAAALAGLVTIFLPQFTAFTAFSHNSKFVASVLIPLIFMLTYKMFQKKSLLYFSLLALTLGFQMLRAHVQVCYYTYLMLGVFFVINSVFEWRQEKSVKNISTHLVLLGGAVVAGVLLSSVIYVSVFDYQQFSIRGAGAGNGLDFGYATNWSFHPIEMITFLIPSFMGYGGATYWGKMPFADYPYYFGIFVFLLAGIPFILKRDKITWSMGFVSLFALLVSFGKHFSILYTPMFKFLPFFNKFRVPSMIHIILDIALVILAAYGLHALMEIGPKLSDKKYASIKKALNRYLVIFTSVVAVLALFVLLGKSVLLGMIADARANLDAAQRELAYTKAVTDSLKAIVFAGLGFFIIAQFLKNKLSGRNLAIFIIILSVIDVWMVGSKIVNPLSPSSEKMYFAETPAVKFIKSQNDNSRIFPVLDDKSGNWYMYHLLQNIQGYSAAKLRIYQDFLNETGFDSRDQAGLNPFLSKYWRYAMRDKRPTWIPVPVQQIDPKNLSFHASMLDMLNVKYIINSYLPINDPRYRQVFKEENTLVYENTTVLPKAFFVDSVVVLKNRQHIFDEMKKEEFDPGKLAVIEKEAPFALSSSDGNVVDLTGYELHKISLDAHVKAPTLLVLSEIYFPSGWKAFVDGQETEIFKTNYILRSVFLQPGDHKIVFRFNPASFKIGLWMSLGTLMALVGLFGVTFFNDIKGRFGKKPPFAKESGE